MKEATSNAVAMAVGAAVAALLVVIDDKLTPKDVPAWIPPTASAVLGGAGAWYAYSSAPQLKASGAILAGSLAAATLMVVSRTKVTIGSFNPQYVAPSLAGR